MFSANTFQRWASHLKISSKDKGLIQLTLNNAQKYFISEVERAFKENKRAFVVLKARQLGITTITSALDLYWLHKIPSIYGHYITDNESNKEYMREILSDYIKWLPKHMKYPIRRHARTVLILKNGSRMFYSVASKKNSGLGQGKGISLLHATEVSSYENEDGFKSLLASLSDKNPNRLYVFESTAKGFNLFYEMWETAQRSPYYHPIFIAWWRHEDYKLDQDDPRFAAYSGRVNADERRWINEIERRYNHQITQNQLAWWRWKLNEEMFEDTLMMGQEYPSLPEEAFISTGGRYISGEDITKAYREAKKCNPKTFRVVVGSTIQAITLKEDKRNPNLWIWEEPRENGIYLIGVDTAYGTSVDSDSTVIEVFRIWADKVIQVAEFVDNNVLSYQTAWIIAFLAGMFSNSYINIEVNGSGYAVLTELKNLRAGISLGGVISDDWRNPLRNIKQYIWSRPDSIMGVSSSYHWKTSATTKRMMCDAFRDLFHVGMLEVKSIELLEEMRFIIDDGYSIGAQKPHHDDRFMASSIAAIYYRQHIQPVLWQRKFTYVADQAKEEEMVKQLNPYYQLLVRAQQQLKKY